MACKKYTLTNGTPSTQTFSYQECSNNMWIYDVLLEPGQTKTIWFVTSTFQSYYTNSITIVDDGAFPPTPSASAVVPSPTPSISPSGSPTQTPTQTPTTTPTPTLTPSITPSITASVTPTSTLTPTPSITPSATPSFNFKLGNVNTGGVYVSGITPTAGTIVTKSGYSYPVNESQLLFADYTQSGGDLDFDIDIKDPSASDYKVVIKINNTVSQELTPGPGDVNLPVNLPGLFSGNTDVIFVEIQDL
jgi:hypothetical protein